MHGPAIHANHSDSAAGRMDQTGKTGNVGGGIRYLDTFRSAEDEFHTALGAQTTPQI
jgi:hypothetical protein